MKKLKLAVFGEKPYMDRLASCIQKNAPDYMEVSKCMKEECLKEFLDKVQPQILLCEAVCKKSLIPEDTFQFVLTASMSQADMGENGEVIFRYQKGAEILRQVFHTYQKYKNYQHFSSNKPVRLEMEAVYTPGGNEYQLFFSMAYAMLKGAQRKTLFLDLEAFSGMKQMLGESGENHMSDLLYGIRQKKDNISLLLQSVLHHGAYIDYVLPPENPRDVYEITVEEIREMVRLLEEQTEYQLIIWNIGTLNLQMEEVMRHCQKVFCLYRENQSGRTRKQAFTEFLEKDREKDWKERIKMVVLQSPSYQGVQGLDIWQQLGRKEWIEQIQTGAGMKEGIHDTGNGTATAADSGSAGYVTGKQ